MPRYAYVNGRFVPHNYASVHVEDRGNQFADAVYEVIPVSQNRMIDVEPHWDRLERSLFELDIAAPKNRQTLSMICRELLRRNRIINGAVYVQVSRGVAKRDHLYDQDMTPGLIVTAKSAIFKVCTKKSLRVKTVPDIRWGRVDIKTVGLLPNSMAKTEAVRQGFDDAWLIDDKSYVTEGTSNNAWIVTIDANNDIKLITRNANTSILNGVTRLRVLELVSCENWILEERAFTLDEARSAQEAFVTSATNFVKPVTQIDNQIIGTGKPGPVTIAIGKAYQDYVDTVF